MTRHSNLYGFLSVFLLGMVLLFQTGCGKKKEPQPKGAAQVNAPQSQAAANGYTFDQILAGAVQEEKFFSSLCRLVLTRSVLFAVDGPAAEGTPTANKEKFSIKILKKEGSAGQGIAMIFSSKEALVASGEKFGWQKDQKGAYRFAAMKGPAAFKVLKANGYQSAVLDAANPKAFVFSAAQMAALADGQVPPFHASV